MSLGDSINFLRRLKIRSPEGNRIGVFAEVYDGDQKIGNVKRLVLDLEPDSLIVARLDMYAMEGVDIEMDFHQDDVHKFCPSCGHELDAKPAETSVNESQA